MINKSDFRLILSDINDARTNMAIDKAICLSYKDDELPVLRLYGWEKCFTIGLGQNLDNFKDLQKEYNKNCAKRLTGGGVLFHGHDISYSILLSNKELGSLRVKQSYEKICQFLLNFYKDLGLNPYFAKDSQTVKLSKNEFCQVGFEAYDILVKENKIGGNAQKRSKKYIFQHGSIPLKKTIKNKKFGMSLEDFDIEIDFYEAREKLINSFKKTYDSNLVESELNGIEKEKVKIILEGK